MGARGEERTEEIFVFWVDERFLFKHYFDEDEVFSRLAEYYNNHQYRFEIPPDEFGGVKGFLKKYGYDLTVIDDVDEFVVVVRKYTDHPENIFKSCVIHRGTGNYNCFLLTDKAAVAEAVSEGAVRLPDTTLENPF